MKRNLKAFLTWRGV